MGKKNARVDIHSGEQPKATVTIPASSRSSMDSNSDRVDVQYTSAGTFTDRIVETLSIWTSDVVEGVFFGPYDEPRVVKQSESAAR